MHGGLKLDLADIDAGVLPICWAIYAQFSPAQAESGGQRNNQIKVNQTNIV